MKPTKSFRVGAAARILAALLAVAAMPAAHAAGFTNGDFASTLGAEWNPHGYRRPYMTPGFVQNSSLTPIVPQQFSDLGLTNMDIAGTDSAGNAQTFTSQSRTFQGAGTVTSTGGAILPNMPLTYPSNVLRVHDDTNGGTGANKPGGNNTKASVVSQEITLAAADFDPRDNKVHVRFQGAPVLEYLAGHNGTNQSYFFIEIIRNEGTPTAVRSYTTYNFAGQPGVVFQTAGNYRYTAWTDFDIVVPGAVAGDKITLRVVAAGCGDTGHAGAFYMHEVRTGGNGVNSSPVPGLWIAIDDYPGAVKQYTNPDGSTDIEYTYRYTNTGGTNLTGVVAQPDLPVTSGGVTTTFLGFTKNPDPGFPNAGACTGTNSADMSCQIGDLVPGDTGTFKLKVRVPAGTSATVNNGNYPISANGVPPQSGQLVQTLLQADMVPDVSKVPPSLPLGQPVPAGAQISCTNKGATAAVNATCSPTGLPTGVTLGQCTVNGVNWSQGDAVPVGQTVVCPLVGTPTDPANAGSTKNVKVTGNANNSSPSLGGAGNVVQVAPPAGPQSIPTLSEWGLILLSALVGLFMVGMQRRRMF